MMNIRPEYVKQNRGVFGTLLQIAKTENPRTLFRGVGVVASGAGPAHALYFSCYETSKNFLSGNSRSSVWVQGNVTFVYTHGFLFNFLYCGDDDNYWLSHRLQCGSGHFIS